MSMRPQLESNDALSLIVLLTKNLTQPNEILYGAPVLGKFSSQIFSAYIFHIFLVLHTMTYHFFYLFKCRHFVTFVLFGLIYIT